MNNLSNDKQRYYIEKLFYSIDRILSKERFTETMDERGKKIYNLGKRQLVESVVTWWKIENLKPLLLDPNKAIENTKKLLLREDFIKNMIKKDNMELKILEMALTHMIIAPNIFLIEETGIQEKYEKYEKYINVIKANIRNVCRVGYKYSDFKKDQNVK